MCSTVFKRYKINYSFLNIKKIFKFKFKIIKNIQINKE